MYTVTLGDCVIRAAMQLEDVKQALTERKSECKRGKTGYYVSDKHIEHLEFLKKWAQTEFDIVSKLAYELRNRPNMPADGAL